ncbi:MAG: hypothetical protein Q4B87_01795, partial [Candidatus Saccharibacteria bacterium]|nr:hypothetical protein [Candidatus Saccharibacteria bacterium]
MVRSIHKTNISAALALAVLAITGTTISINNAAHAASDGDVTFNVSVTEMLTVELSTPTTWAEGDLNTLLVNKVNVAAKTNNTVGALVSMYANGTRLQNKTSYSDSVASTYIDSITAPVTAANFNNDAWGYSEDSTNYNAIPTSTNPVALFASVGAGTRADQDVYFGAKATGAKDSGTYAQTVNFVAVTGTVDTSDTPVIPTPSNTSTDVIANNTPIYNSTSNQTSYTTR